MASCAADAGAAMVLMHSRGSPQRLHGLPALKRPLQSVLAGLRHSVDKALRAGIPRNRIVLDPGLGFGKGVEDNLVVLRRLEVLKRFRLPILVGPSRKSFIGNLLDLPVEQRLLGEPGQHGRCRDPGSAHRSRPRRWGDPPGGPNV